ncbi:MAG: hypothetical protein MJE66_20150 [Proteobacteria bacterium]|nr:hypothetical protein [Pseudomonadota bacterium]
MIENGEVDAGQLREAIRLMKRDNRSLGDYAVEAGWLTEAETVRVNAAQMQTDRPFGLLAVEMGLLEQEQLQSLVAKQDAEKLRVGEALVQLGHLNETDLARLLEQFKADQAAYETGDLQLPAALGDRHVVKVVLDLMPRFTMRIARLHLKVEPEGESVTEAPSLAAAATVGVSGSEAVDVTLLCDRTLGEHLAAGASGLDRRMLDEGLLSDGVGEFLNVVVGNALGVAEREGMDLALEPPRFDETPSEGVAFRLVSVEGEGVLLFTPR